MAPQKPQHDPIPAPRRSTVERVRRIFRLLAILSALVGAIAAAAVAHGDPQLHVHMIVATFLGAGLTVFLGGSLMTLMFISASSGHDDAANDFDDYKDEE